MELARSIGTALFSRELRRRAGGAMGHGRGTQPPSTTGRQRPGGGCCLILILALVAIIVYLFLEVYVLNPEQKKSTEGPSTRIAQAQASVEFEMPPS